MPAERTDGTESENSLSFQDTINPSELLLCSIPWPHWCPICLETELVFFFFVQMEVKTLLHAAEATASFKLLNLYVYCFPAVLKQGEIIKCCGEYV